MIYIKCPRGASTLCLLCTVRLTTGGGGDWGDWGGGGGIRKGMVGGAEGERDQSSLRINTNNKKVP